MKTLFCDNQLDLPTFFISIQLFSNLLPPGLCDSYCAASLSHSTSPQWRAVAPCLPTRSQIAMPKMNVIQGRVRKPRRSARQCGNAEPTTPMAGRVRMEGFDSQQAKFATDYNWRCGFTQELPAQVEEAASKLAKQAKEEYRPIREAEVGKKSSERKNWLTIPNNLYVASV